MNISRRQLHKFLTALFGGWLMEPRNPGQPGPVNLLPSRATEPCSGRISEVGGATCPKCGWKLTSPGWGVCEDYWCHACTTATDITGIATRDFERGEVVSVLMVHQGTRHGPREPRFHEPLPGPHYDLAVILQPAKRGEECVARVKGKVWVDLMPGAQMRGIEGLHFHNETEMRMGQRKVGEYLTCGWVEWDGTAQ